MYSIARYLQIVCIYKTRSLNLEAKTQTTNPMTATLPSLPLHPNYRPAISPVDLRQPVRLPEPWPSLEKTIDPDLLLRARGFMLAAEGIRVTIQGETVDMHEVAEVMLNYVGLGFTNSFDPNHFAFRHDDPDFKLKQAMVRAIAELSEQFGARIPSTLWYSLCYLGTRENPQQHATIISQKDKLPFPWFVVDTHLHAIGKVFRLFMHIQSVIHANTGMVLNHNCDCGCDVAPATAEGIGGIMVRLHDTAIGEASQAFLSHLLSESMLLIGLRMPFNMGISPEAGEAIGLV